MIAGLPWESWLLLLGSVGLPLAAVIAFARAQRRARTRNGTRGVPETQEPRS